MSDIKITPSTGQNAQPVERKPQQPESRDDDQLADEGASFADKLKAKPGDKEAVPMDMEALPKDEKPLKESRIFGSDPALQTKEPKKKAVQQSTVPPKTKTPVTSEKVGANSGLDKTVSVPKEKPVSNPESEKPTTSAGDSILASMFGGNVDQTKTSQAVGEVSANQINQPQDTSASRDISRVAEMIADRILVSDSKFSDQKMISIKVKDDILPQTEIKISTEGGKLKIEVQTGNADSFNFLGSQKDGLVRHLEKTLNNQEIEVSVEMEGDADSDTNSDGRSRNQRDAFEEMAEQDEN